MHYTLTIQPNAKKWLVRQSTSIIHLSSAQDAIKQRFLNSHISTSSLFGNIMKHLFHKLCLSVIQCEMIGKNFFLSKTAGIRTESQAIIKQNRYIDGHLPADEPSYRVTALFQEGRKNPPSKVFRPFLQGCFYIRFNLYVVLLIEHSINISVSSNAANLIHPLAHGTGI